MAGFRNAIGLVLLFCLWSVPAPARTCKLPDRFSQPRIKLDWRNPQAPFDYLALVLSWSPEFCHDRGQRPDSAFQCHLNRFGWVVHGLWPQSAKARSKYDHPRFCRLEPLPSQADIEKIYCLMPSVRLIYGEWLKHGSCAFTMPRDYFASISLLWDKIRKPDLYKLTRQKKGNLKIGDVEEAFLTLNRTQGMRRSSVMVRTDRAGFLEEVRICLTRNLEYRPCHAKRFNAQRRLKIGKSPTIDPNNKWHGEKSHDHT